MRHYRRLDHKSTALPVRKFLYPFSGFLRQNHTVQPSPPCLVTNGFYTPPGAGVKQHLQRHKNLYGDSHGCLEVPSVGFRRYREYFYDFSADHARANVPSLQGR